ncbi:uracil DNA N-glycosylase Thp1 [Parahypoxylon ruwenzoriense]
MATEEEEGRVAVAETNDVSKEPSFEGRLQLKDFMFAGSSYGSPSPGPRRSQRLATPQSSASSQLSLSESNKRKAEPDDPDADKSSSSSRSNRRKVTRARTRTERSADAPASLQSPKGKREHQTASYAPPSTYAHLPCLPDAVAPNLLILTIGLNPGIQTARSGHAYAHPSNLYWKLLYSSGITPIPCTPQEDQQMPARYSLGHTNIVARPSRNGAELSNREMDDGVSVLEAKCRKWRPEVACVVGKSIWESIFRVRKGRALAKGEFRYGWQDGERMGAVRPGEEGEGNEPWEGSMIFVATSTSGLAASLSMDEKKSIWKELGDWCVNRRKEREEAAKAVAAAAENAAVSGKA